MKTAFGMLACMLLSSVPAVHAEMYKCINEQKKIIYTDMPCTKFKATTQKIVSPTLSQGLVDQEAIYKSQKYYKAAKPAPASVTRTTVTETTIVNGIPVISQTGAHNAMCKSYRQQLEAIENKLRHGYTAAEDQYLHDQQKYWQKMVFDNCATNEGF